MVNKKSEMLSFRVDKDLFAYLQESARTTGLSVGETIRRILEGAMHSDFYENPENRKSVGPPVRRWRKPRAQVVWVNLPPGATVTEGGLDVKVRCS